MRRLRRSPWLDLALLLFMVIAALTTGGFSRGFLVVWAFVAAYNFVGSANKRWGLKP
jgi:hypothetical protein